MGKLTVYKSGARRVDVPRLERTGALQLEGTDYYVETEFVLNPLVSGPA